MRCTLKLNPIALRKAKIVYNFGLSECNRVKFLFVFLFQPLMRAASEKTPTMTVKQATEVIDNCMKVLFYRDARSLNKVRVKLH